MATDESTPTQEQVEQPEITPAPPALSSAFSLTLAEQPMKLLFEGFDYDPGIYIEAKHPGLEEDDISNDATEMRYHKTVARKKKGGDEEIDATQRVKPAAFFMAKCRAQITDFRLPIDGSFRVFGKPATNDEVYEALLKFPKLPGADMSLRHLVEGFLDYVAGRDTMVQRDFEALFSEQPRLVSTT